MLTPILPTYLFSIQFMARVFNVVYGKSISMMTLSLTLVVLLFLHVSDILSGFILIWRDPIQASMEKLLEGYNAGCIIGDQEVS